MPVGEQDVPDVFCKTTSTKSKTKTNTMKNKETVSRFTYSSIKTVWFYLNNIIFRHFLHEQLVLWVLRHCIFSLRFDLMWFLFFEIHDVCFNLDVFFFFLFYVVCQPTRHSLYRKFEVRAFHLACHSFVHTNILTTPTQPVALYPTGCARVLPPLILLARIYVCKSNQLTTTVYKTPRFQTFASPLGSLLPGGLATLCWNFSSCYYGQMLGYLLSSVEFLAFTRTGSLLIPSPLLVFTKLDALTM